MVDGHGWFGSSLYVGGCLHLWVVGFVFWVVVAVQVIGGHWHSWAIMKAVVVKSMVGGSDKHGWWWWWEEEMVVVGRK